MTVVISPPMFLQFFNPNNSGAPASGYKLFTYLAGTTTKQATWTDSTQTIQNANPIILDSSGGAYVWGDPTLAYKFVWTLPNDTDPPTSAIRTVGNITFPISLAALQTITNAPVLPSYARTAAEIAAGVIPTNYSYPNHITTGYAHLQRYGGDPSGVTASDTAFQSAALVAAQLDIPIGIPMPNIGASWLFNTAWTLSTSARVIGLGGRPTLKFGSIASSTICVSLGGSSMPQVELRNLIFNFNVQGQDGCILIGSDEPIIDNVQFNNSQRDAFGIVVSGGSAGTGGNWIEKGSFNRIYINNAGRHAVRLEMDGGGGAFINECIWQHLIVRGCSKQTPGGMALYLTSTATTGASTISDHLFLDSQFDCGYSSGVNIPNSSPVSCDSGLVDSIVFINAGWENTGQVLLAGPYVNLTGTGSWNGLVLLSMLTNSFWGGQKPAAAITSLVNFDLALNASAFMGPATITKSVTTTSGAVLALVNALGSQNTLFNGSGNTTASGANDIQIQRTGASNSSLGRGANINLVNTTGGTTAGIQEFTGNLITFANGTEAFRGTSDAGIQIAQASVIYSGSGAPSAGLGGNGSFYFRDDTPGTANQRLYVKSGGAWSGIL